VQDQDGSGRVAAHEIMIGTPAIRNLIRENKSRRCTRRSRPGSNWACRRSTRTAGAGAAQLIAAAEARGKAANKDNFPG